MPEQHDANDDGSKEITASVPDVWEPQLLMAAESLAHSDVEHR